MGLMDKMYEDSKYAAKKRQKIMRQLLGRQKQKKEEKKLKQLERKN